jgi:integrase
MPSGQTVDRNIFKRKGIYYVRFTDATGKQRVKSTRSREKKHALALRAKLEAEAFERREFPARNKSVLTMKQLRDMAVRHLDAQRKSTDHVRHLDAAVEWFGEHRYAATLTFEEMADYRDALSKKPNGSKRATSTVNGYLVDLLTALNLAVDARRLDHNPLHGFKLQKPRNQRDRVATQDEFERLMAIADEELRLAITIAYYTPMRLGEIAALERSRVFLRQRFIAIGEAYTKNDEGRLVPMAPPVVEEMRRFLERHPERSGRLIQPERSTIRKAVNAISKRFAKLADEAKCPDLTFHDLKHTSLTNYRLAGMDFAQMQRISGNKTVELLVKRYQKVVDDELLAAVDRAAERADRKV